MKKCIVLVAGLVFFSSVSAALSCPREKIVRRERVVVEKQVVRRQPVRRTLEFVAPPYRENVQRERVILREVAPHCNCSGY